MASPTIFNSESVDDNWVIQINQYVSETNLTFLSSVPICIYQVPPSLRCAKPEAFTPQLIAIGPYNHFRPELYTMERFKIRSVKRVLEFFGKHDVKQLVDELNSSGPSIRACYQKYLDLKDNTLLYTLVIDALFLLDFYHNYVNDEVSSSFLTGLEQEHVNGVKLTKNGIIRDMVMVENQIPTFVLKRILSIETSKPINSFDEDLGLMLLSFCENHCPIKLTQTRITCSEAVTKHHHLLDLMYHFVVSMHEKSETSKLKSKASQGILELETIISKPGTSTAVPVCKSSDDNVNTTDAADIYNKSSTEDRVTVFKKVKDALSWILSFVKRLNISNIELDSSETSLSKIEPPAVVTIPSVCKLHSVGIRFEPSKGGIMAIQFNEKKGIFYLPVIKLDVNSEVIMRNLVAYEALTKPDFLIFTRYTELMKEIIETEKDVELLKEAEIIESTSTLGVIETDKLFNGMSKSIGATKTKDLDDIVNKVNKYFHKKWKVNLFRNFTEYVYSSWKLYTLVSTLMLLAMTALETFCTAYDCPSKFTSNSNKLSSQPPVPVPVPTSTACPNN